VFTLFQPIRGRLQRLVDRRFNRAHIDAERTVAAFGSRLRDEVDLESLQAEFVATVLATVEPASTSLWLRHQRSAPGWPAREAHSGQAQGWL